MMRVRPPWHSLLAPLPPEARPRREPFARALQGMPEAKAVEGWEQLVLELSAGSAGLRVLHLLLDRSGTPLSASDLVLYTSGAPEEPLGRSEQQSIGGRFEPDGRFRGTRWSATARSAQPDREPEWELHPSEPTDDEVTALRALVAELLRRA